jgi:hypothetical protein
VFLCLCQYASICKRCLFTWRAAAQAIKKEANHNFLSLRSFFASNLLIIVPNNLNPIDSLGVLIQVGGGGFVVGVGVLVLVLPDLLSLQRFTVQIEP